MDGHPVHVLFFGSTSVAGNLPVGNTTCPDIVADYRRSFARLKTLPVDVFLANHPSFAHQDEKLAKRQAGQPNPFMDPQEFQAFILGGEADFDAELKIQGGK